MMKIIAPVVVCLLCGLPAFAQDPNAIKTTVSNYLSEQVQQKRFQYGAVVLVQGDRVILSQGFGGAEPDKTIFRIASISKLFVATAVMQLVEHGRLDLHADINIYLRGLRAPPTTMEQLLTHTSGLEDRFMGALVNDPKDLLPLGEYFQRAALRRTTPPGEEFAYSNHGMALAGYVVEVISGESFEEYARKHILEPLAMTSSTFHQPPPPQGLPDEALRVNPMLFQPYPAASLMSTTEEMGHFLLASLNQGKYDGRAMLQPATISLMHQTHWTAHPVAQGVAYGFFESRLNGRRALFHTGDSGHHGILWLLPEANLGLYFVCSAGEDTAFEIREKLVQELLNKHFPAGAEEPKYTAPPGSDLSGLYSIAGVNPYSIEKIRGLMSQIRIEQNRPEEFRIHPPGMPEMTAVAIADRLYRTSDGAMLAFSADGRIGTFSGSVSDPMSFHRIPRWQDARLHLFLFALSVLLLLSGLIVGCKRNWRRFLLPASLLILAPLTAVSTFFIWHPPFTRLPMTIRAAVCLLFAACLAAIWSLTEVKKREGWPRAYVFLFGGAGGLLLALLTYWHITPWHVF